MHAFSFEEFLKQMKAAEKIRRNVLRLMEQYEMTGSDFARLIKRDPTVVSRWLRGVYDMTLDSLDVICEGTGWPLEELVKPIAGEEPTSPKVKPAEIHRSATVVSDFVHETLGKVPAKKIRKPKKAN